MSAQCPGFVVTFYDASSISTGLKSRFDYSSTISTCLKETRLCRLANLEVVVLRTKLKTCDRFYELHCGVECFVNVCVVLGTCFNVRHVERFCHGLKRSHSLNHHALEEVAAADWVKIIATSASALFTCRRGSSDLEPTRTLITSSLPNRSTS